MWRAVVAAKVVKGRGGNEPAPRLIPLIPAPAVLEARPGEPVALPDDLDCRRTDGRG